MLETDNKHALNRGGERGAGEVRIGEVNGTKWDVSARSMLNESEGASPPLSPPIFSGNILIRNHMLFNVREIFANRSLNNSSALELAGRSVGQLCGENDVRRKRESMRAPLVTTTSITKSKR